VSDIEICIVSLSISITCWLRKLGDASSYKTFAFVIHINSCYKRQVFHEELAQRGSWADKTRGL